MDDLERLLRESSNTPRDLKPPKGQWESIRSQISDEEAIGTAGASKSAWNYSLGLRAGLILLAVATAFFVFRPASYSEAPDNQQPASSTPSISPAPAPEEIHRVAQPTDTPVAANLSLPANSEVNEPNKDHSNNTLAETSISAPVDDILPTPPQKHATTYSTTDLEPESSDQAVLVDTDVLSARLRSVNTLAPTSIAQIETKLPEVYQGVMPVVAAAPKEESDGWTAAPYFKEGWDVSLHTIILPIGSISSYVTEYSSLPMEGSGAEVFEFDGQEINLFRVNGSDFEIPGRASWFFTASLGASYQFANGLRLGLGVSYFDVSLFGRGGLKSEFPEADETFFLRERRYDNEVLLARLDFDYLILSRKRFSIAVGATISGRINSRYLHRHQLFQPFSQTKERLRNENTFFINNSINQGLVVLPQAEFGYRISPQTDLSLGLGARLGLGLRHHIH
ncbi:MAG: hypothetical protein AAFP08_05325 [Bacteroidota bacterium]